MLPQHRRSTCLESRRGLVGEAPSVIYAHFVEEFGEEAAQAMLDQFPVRDADELVTRDYLARQMAELRVEMGKQTERLMTRMQIVVGVGFAAFSALVLAVR